MFWKKSQSSVSQNSLIISINWVSCFRYKCQGHSTEVPDSLGLAQGRADPNNGYISQVTLMILRIRDVWGNSVLDKPLPQQLENSSFLMNCPISMFLLCLLSKCRRRRRWQSTLVLLPGKSHGRRSLVGCSPWGREELDTTEQLHFHFSLSSIGEGNGNPFQCSCLENPRDGGAWWAAISGVAQSQTRLKWLSSSSSSTLIASHELTSSLTWLWYMYRVLRAFSNSERSNRVLT